MKVKRLLSAFLILCMMASVVPMSVWADDGPGSYLDGISATLSFRKVESQQPFQEAVFSPSLDLSKVSNYTIAIRVKTTQEVIGEFFLDTSTLSGSYSALSCALDANGYAPTDHWVTTTPLSPTINLYGTEAVLTITGRDGGTKTVSADVNLWDSGENPLCHRVTYKNPDETVIQTDYYSHGALLIQHSLINPNASGNFHVGWAYIKNSSLPEDLTNTPVEEDIILYPVYALDTYREITSFVFRKTGTANPYQQADFLPIPIDDIKDYIVTISKDGENIGRYRLNLDYYKNYAGANLNPSAFSFTVGNDGYIDAFWNTVIPLLPTKNLHGARATVRINFNSGTFINKTVDVELTLVHTVTYTDVITEYSFTQSYSDGAALVYPPDPSRIGYVFDGWVESSGTTTSGKGFSSNGGVGEDTPITGDLSLEPIWTLDLDTEYNINYNYSLETGKYTDPGNVSTYTAGGDPVTIYPPSAVGHTFIGWYVVQQGVGIIDINSIGTWNSTNKELTFNSNVYGHFTFNAIWDQAEYSIDYYLDEPGSSPYSLLTTRNFIDGQPIFNPTPTPIPGYSAGDWKFYSVSALADGVIPEGTAEFDTEGIMPGEDLVAVASYQIKSYSIYYYIDGEYFDTQTGVEFGSDLSSTLLPLKPDELLKKYSGWYTAIGAGAGDGDFPPVPDEMPAHDLYLYAISEPIEFFVKFVYCIEELDGTFSSSLDTGYLPFTTDNPDFLSSLVSSFPNYAGFSFDHMSYPASPEYLKYTDFETFIANVVHDDDGDNYYHINVAYLRNEYTVTYYLDNVLVSGPVTVKFEDSLPVDPVLPTLGAGSEYSPWLWSTITKPDTMPASDVTAHSITMQAQIPYTLNIYFDDLDGNSELGYSIPMMAGANQYVGDVAENLKNILIFDGFDYSDYGFIFTVPVINTNPKITDKIIEINLYYTRNSYTVIFLDGDGSVLDAVPFLYEEIIDTDGQTVTKLGHTFLGWQIPYGLTMPAYDITIEPIFEPISYIVRYRIPGFNLNNDIDHGGLIINPTDTNLYYQHNAIIGDRLWPAVPPAIEGYKFAGWFFDEDFVIPASVYYTGNHFVLNDNIIQSFLTVHQTYGSFIILYAKYEIQSYSITVNYVTYDDYTGATTFNPANNPIIVTDVEYGAALDTILDTYKQDVDGYSFKEFNGLPATMPGGDITVTAIYNLKRFSVTYQNGGGTVLESYEAFHGLALTEMDLSALPEFKGYTVSWKWYTADLTELPAIPSTVTEDLIAIAILTPNVYQISFKIVNAPVPFTIDPVMRAYGDSVFDLFVNDDYLSPAMEARFDGQYTFSGWHNLHVFTSPEAISAFTMPPYNVELTGFYIDNAVDYDVNIFFMNDDGVYPTPGTYNVTPDYTMSLAGKVGTTINFSDLDFDEILGFTIDDDKTPTLSLTLPLYNDSGDKPTFDIYFKRIAFDITYNVTKDGAPLGSVSQTYYYGEEYTTLRKADFITAAEGAAGYSFSAWTVEPYNYRIFANNTYKMPARNLDVYGILEKKDFTITYKLDMPVYGTTNTINTTYAQDVITFGDPVVPQVAPEILGYTFDGWVWPNDEIPATMPSENITVTGSYTATTYRVHYLQGYSLFGNPIITTREYSYGQPLNNPASPSKFGYNFDNWIWYIDESMTEKTNPLGQIPTNMPAYDLYADPVFTIRTFDIIYSYEGTTYYKDTYNYGDFPSYNFVSTVYGQPYDKHGYTFIGWDWNGDGRVNTADSIRYSENLIFANLRLMTRDADISIEAVAVYVPNKHNVKYNISYFDYSVNSLVDITADGGTTFTYEFGQSLSDLNREPADMIADTFAYDIDDFYFTGWNFNFDIETANMPDEDLEFNGYLIPKSDTDLYTIVTYLQDVNGTTYTAATSYNIPTILTQILTITEIVGSPNGFTYFEHKTTVDNPNVIEVYFNRNSYKLSYKYTLEGTTFYFGYDNYLYEAAVTAKNLPVVPGYRFIGWNNVPTTMPANNVTATGYFEIIDYNINYNLGLSNPEGVIFDAIPLTYNVKTSSFYLNNPSKEGLTFLGWVETDANGVQIDSSEPSTSFKFNVDMDRLEDRYFHAMWQKNTYRIAFHPNKGYVADAGYAGSSPVYKTYTCHTWELLLPGVTFKRDYHTLIGWAYNSSATTPDFYFGAAVKNLSLIEGDTVTLYAVWSRDDVKTQTIVMPVVQPEQPTNVINPPSSSFGTGYFETGDKLVLGGGISSGIVNNSGTPVNSNTNTNTTVTAPSTTPTGLSNIIKTSLNSSWNNPFIDISPNSSYYNAIRFVYTNGLFMGISSNEFAPDMTMTRGMFVTVLGRLSGVKATATGRTTFNDVPSNAWYAPYVQWANSNGIVEGYSSTSFGPDDVITREQMLVIMYRFAEYCGADVTGLSNTTLNYSDINNASSWALTAIKYAKKNNLISTVGSVYPKRDAKRTDVAEILYNFVRNVND